MSNQLDCVFEQVMKKIDEGGVLDIVYMDCGKAFDKGPSLQADPED